MESDKLLNEDKLAMLHARGIEVQPYNDEWTLFVKGALPPKRIGVIGARASDKYGLVLAHQIAQDLSAMGIAVVSGGAEGCDKAAHEGALEAGGQTVVVLPCGHDEAYPPRHRPLYERIARQGAVVSPFWLDEKPTRPRFLRRNRCLAALCDAVIVVRASEASGTTHTARATRKLQKPLAAVPGAIGEGLSQGTHQLLEEGASILTSRKGLRRWVEYIYGIAVHAPSGEWPLRYRGQEAPWEPIVSEQVFEFTDNEALLARVIRAESGLDLDALVMRSGLTVESLVGLLLGLEVNGIVERMPGGRYRARGQGE